MDVEQLKRVQAVREGKEDTCLFCGRDLRTSILRVCNKCGDRVLGLSRKQLKSIVGKEAKAAKKTKNRDRLDTLLLMRKAKQLLKKAESEVIESGEKSS
jgi:hypothetical protein